MKSVVPRTHVPCAVSGLSDAVDLVVDRVGLRAQLNETDELALYGVCGCDALATSRGPSPHQKPLGGVG